MRESFQDKMRQQWGCWVGAALAVLAGVILFPRVLGDGLTRLSYDLLFLLRHPDPPTEAVIVYLDERSYAVLEQPHNRPWNRTNHAELVRMLTAAQARAVVFDIVFSDPAGDAREDTEFASAITASGRVILGADFAMPDGGLRNRNPTLYDPLLKSATAWGVIQVDADPCFFVRRAFDGSLDNPTLPLAAARFVNPGVTNRLPELRGNHWLNYYGPPLSISHQSYAQALLPDGVPPGYFKDKVVFIGAMPSTGLPGAARDQFGTPFTRWGKGFAPGVEIHATAFLNILHQDWLRRPPAGIEFAVILFFGAAFGFWLPQFRPLPAVGVALAGLVALVLAQSLLLRAGNIWFAWMIVTVQLGLALAWAILFRSLQWYAERRLLMDTLSVHLSPKRARQLLQNPKLLRPGGEEQEISILFSDIANFSKVTEQIHPRDLFALMNQYFQASLSCIFKTDGTVVQLIGDAIFAVWNAPVAQADHCELACRTALLMREQLMEFDAAQLSLPLRTRVGLHTGTAVVGNVGSAARFNYGAMGDSINLASRLEGLNKYLGTEILATRAIQIAVEGKLASRLVGHFKFKGMARAVEVHELIGQADQIEPTRLWRQAFAEALKDYQRMRFDKAEAGFRRTLELKGEDGHSKFYLGKIDALRNQPLPGEWEGETEMFEK